MQVNTILGLVLALGNLMNTGNKVCVVVISLPNQCLLMHNLNQLVNCFHRSEVKLMGFTLRSSPN